jgi:ATP-binding cassette, subfamily B, bacterial
MTSLATNAEVRSAGPFPRLRRGVARLSPLMGGRRPTLIIVAMVSTAAGIAEAGVLALIARIAAAMSGGLETAVRFGPFDLRSSTSSLLVIAAALAVVRLVLQLVVARLPASLSAQVQSRLRTRLFDAFLAASWTARSAEKEGHLQELMGGQTNQAGNAVIQVANGFSAALMFLTLAASAFVLSPGVAAAVMAMAALLFVGLRPLSRQVRRRSAATSAAYLMQATGVAESVRMAEEIQVFGATGAERSRIEAFVFSLEDNLIRMRTLSRIVPVLYESAVIIMLIAGLTLLYAIGTARLAVLGAVVLLLVRAASYGQQFQTAYQGLGESLPYLDRLTTVVDRYRSSERRQGHRHIDSIRSVSFEGVSFAYREDTLVLRDMNFHIEAGEAVGVVGPTGAGKSTLMQLLLGLREPTMGRYLVNGIPAAEIDDETWRRKVVYLPQEPHLLNATVSDNIRFFRDWVDDGAVERAARLAHIHAEIASWRNGYETVIGQRANAVSGGERQRLCLARALAGDPELLILDEPTSSLDARSEQLIQESLEGLRGHLTIVVVAHRLTTLGLCDRVMVIGGGHLEAFEHAESLYRSNDFYRHAVDLASIGNPALAPHDGNA